MLCVQVGWHVHPWRGGQAAVQRGRAGLSETKHCSKCWIVPYNAHCRVYPPVNMSVCSNAAFQTCPPVTTTATTTKPGSGEHPMAGLWRSLGKPQHEIDAETRVFEAMRTGNPVQGDISCLKESHERFKAEMTEERRQRLDAPEPGGPRSNGVPLTSC